MVLGVRMSDSTRVTSVMKCLTDDQRRVLVQAMVTHHRLLPERGTLIARRFDRVRMGGGHRHWSDARSLPALVRACLTQFKREPRFWSDAFAVWAVRQGDHRSIAGEALKGFLARNPQSDATALTDQQLEEVVSQVVNTHCLVPSDARLAVDLVRFGVWSTGTTAAPAATESTSDELVAPFGGDEARVAETDEAPPASLTELLARADRLERRCRDAAEVLRATASAWEEGRPEFRPVVKLALELDAVWGLLRQSATSLGVVETTAPATMGVFCGAVAAELDRRERAPMEALRQRVDCLGGRGEGAATLESLRQRLGHQLADPSLAPSVVAGAEVLLEACDPSTSMARREELFDALSEHFGRPVAFGVVRGDIFLETQAATASSAPAAVETQRSSAPVASGAPAPTSIPAPVTPSGSEVTQSPPTAVANEPSKVAEAIVPSDSGGPVVDPSSKQGTAGPREPADSAWAETPIEGPDVSVPASGQGGEASPPNEAAFDSPDDVTAVSPVGSPSSDALLISTEVVAPQPIAAAYGADDTTTVGISGAERLEIPVPVLARRALEARGADRRRLITQTVQALCLAGDYSAAWALAAAAESDQMLREVTTVSAQEGLAVLDSALNAELLRGVLFTRRVRVSGDTPTTVVQEAVTTPDGDASRVDDVQLIKASMVLRLALLDRNSGATGLLQSFDLANVGNLPAIRDLIVESARLRIDPGPLLIDRRLTASPRGRSLEERCAEWCEGGVKQRTIYTGATVTLRWMLTSEESELRKMLDAVRRNDRGQRELVSDVVSRASDSGTLDDLVRSSERQARKGRISYDPIVGKAYSVLKLRVAEAAEFGREWLQAAERADGVHGDVPQRFESWRGALERAVVLGVRRLKEELAGASLSVEERVIRGLLLRSLHDMLALLQGGAPVEQASTCASALVTGHALLRLTAFSADDVEMWPDVDYPALPRLLRALEEGLRSGDDALDRLVEAGRLDAAEQLLAAHEAALVPLIEPEAGPHRITEARRRLTADLAVERERLRSLTESAFLNNLLREPERATRVGVVDRLGAVGGDFPGARDEVRAAIDDLLQRYEKNKGDIRLWLEANDTARRMPVAYATIVAALDANDILTATEYRDALERGEEIAPHASTVNVFAERFFPGFVSEASRIDEFPTGKVSDALARGQALGRWPIDQMEPGARRRGRELLLRWMELRAASSGTATNRDLIVERLVELLKSLGFADAQAKPHGEVRSVPGLTALEVITSELTDREVCPVPFFGSQARGLYQIHSVARNVSPDELLRLVPPSAKPTIVLLGQRYSVAHRKMLARICRERSRSLLLVDEIVVLFLALEQFDRLPMLFGCTLPFSVEQPYITSAGLVPREMFFGRESERLQLLSPTGTNLVYGGRQLGKTALLRDVERRHHDKERGQLVIWCDLKQAGVYGDRESAAIWPVIVDLLARHDVVSRNVGRPQRVIEDVRRWLDQRPGRSIVLLLDEADDFIEADRRPPKGTNPYEAIQLLKRLMDETEKRFKFVLAGLHDVQRAARDPNTPLAHLGSPIVVGPLIENGEALEARALIERPLRALGYEFENRDLPTRILSHTNYYPSLIQLFCSQLINHMNRSELDGPPTLITNRHIDAAYNDRKLREAIRERFVWTLQLDLRYKLIAYLIARESLENRDRRESGFSVDEIRRRALDSWPAGFEDDAHEAFSTLLQEMIGLGVLRRTVDARFALRSANVLNLLGNSEEIVQEILSTASQKPINREDYQQHHRRPSGDDLPETTRSPLSRLQEALIFPRERGVSLVFGAKAAALELLPHFLPAGWRSAIVADANDLSAFDEALRKEKSGGDDVPLVQFVTAGVPWTEAWVQRAEAFLRQGRKDRGDRIRRVIFLGDPSAAWRCRDQRTGALRAGEAVVLRPWSGEAARDWLHDSLVLPPNEDDLAWLKDQTGLWPAMVHDLGQELQRESSRARPGRLVDLVGTAAERFRASAALPALFEFPPETIEPLRWLLEHAGTGSFEEVYRVLNEGPIPEDLLRSTLAWAITLHFATEDAKGWTFDPIVTRALLAMVPA